MALKRLDQALLARGLADSRSQAQRMIEYGQVEIEHAGQWQSARKASQRVADSDDLRVHRGDADRYVSRAGLKLEAALQAFDIDPSGVTVLDVGASTGGFTDCVLQAGAARVVSIDVGHNQLHPSLLNDPRVTSLEGVNARALDAEFSAQYSDAGFDLVVMDVSFISQTLILPALGDVMTGGGVLVSLVKPQFEVGPEGLGKGGIVKNDDLKQKALATVGQCAQTLGFYDIQTVLSPILGGDGNEEFLMLARWPGEQG